MDINQKGKNMESKINHICQLCLDDTKKEKVLTYVGGFVGHAHESCAEIANNAIKLYEQYVLFHYKLLPEWQEKHGKTKN